MSLLKFSKVSLVYPNGFRALKDIDLHIDSGEFIAIIGRSGSGKSTLLKTINKTIKISSGSGIVIDRDLSKISGKELRTLRSKIAFIFQQFNLVKNLTALDNVLHGRLSYVGVIRSVLGFYPEKDRRLALEALKSVGLQDKGNVRVDELSGGQQQRVAIARAIVQNPKIILADEPMASLDPKLSEVVLELLHELNTSRQITTLVNLHVLELAKKYATRIIGLREGQIVFDGPPSQLSDDALALIYEGAQS